MSAKFTPGPWRIDGLNVQDGWGNNEDEDRCEIACLPHPTFDALEIYGKRVRDDYAEHEANARLIAAAPDYFAAVQHMEGADLPEDARWHEGFAMLRAAHAKARGEA